jgi:hypothetical protein
MPQQMVHDVKLTTHVFHIFSRIELPLCNGLAHMLPPGVLHNAQVGSAKLTMTKFLPNVQIVDILSPLLQHKVEASRNCC